MFIKLVTITDGNSVFTKNQDSTATEFSNALVPGKKSHLKQGGQIVRLTSFSYGNSGYSISIYIFTNVCFACQEINIVDHYR